MYVSVFVLCNRATLRETRIDLSGVLDDIYTTVMPARVTKEFPIVAASIWKEVLHETAITLRLRMNDEIVVYQAPSLTRHFESQLHVVDLTSLVLEKIGEHVLEIVAEETIMGTIKFGIRCL